MTTRATRENQDTGRKPDKGDGRPATDDDAWLADEIAAGCAELDAGQGIPADQVWKKLEARLKLPCNQ